MVRHKDEPEPFGKNWLKDYLDKFDRDNPVIDTRYYVVEVTPSKKYYYNDGHGGSEWDWTKQTEVRVSEYSKSKEACEKFIETHVADEGKTLAIRSDKLRRTVTERWE